jgi:hypothetical protein
VTKTVKNQCFKGLIQFPEVYKMYESDYPQRTSNKII